MTHEIYPIGGGAGNAAHNLAKEFKNKGHDIFILTCRYKKYVNEEIEGIRYYYVPGFRKNELTNRIILTFSSFILLGFFKTVSIIKKNNINILHCFFTLPAGIIGFLLKLLFRKKYIVSLNGSDVPYYSKLKLVILLKPLIRLIWGKSDRVVSISKGLLETAKLTDMRNENFSVINYGMDNNFLNITSDFIQYDCFSFLSVSRLHYNKGLDTLLHSFGKLIYSKKIKAKLFIAGNGPEEQNLLQVRNRLRLNDHVVFLGYLTQEILIKEMKKVNAFVLPSRTEAFGIVFVEAMACGLPVVGSKIGGIPELINSQVGLLVEVDKIDELTNAMAHIINNYEKYNRDTIVKHAKKFTWEKAANQYLNIFMDI